MSISRLLLRSAFLLASVAVVCSCTSTKLVRVSVEPAEAAIFLDGKEIAKGKYEKIMDFTKTPQFVFSAKLDHYTEAKVTVKFDPESQIDYKMKLDRLYSITVPLIDFAFTKTSTGVKLGFRPTQTIAYYDPMEPSQAVKGLVRVTHNADKDIYYGGPVVSKHADFLVYRVLELDKKSSEIWRQKIGAKGTTRLVNERKSRTVYPCLARDEKGDQLFYSSNRITGKHAIWRKKFDASSRTKISGDLTQAFSASISPNGAQIAYTGLPTEGEDLQIWTMNANGRMPTQICSGYHPQISPDGTKILFLRNDKDTGTPQMWTMDFDGGGETQLTVNADYVVKDPRWSPDGKVIVFASNEGKDDKGRKNFDIWMMESDGAKKTQLTENGSHDDSPCFDRHGEQVFFRSNRGTKWNIWSFKLSERFSKKRKAFEIQ